MHVRTHTTDCCRLWAPPDYCSHGFATARGVFFHVMFVFLDGLKKFTLLSFFVFVGFLFFCAAFNILVEMLEGGDGEGEGEGGSASASGGACSDLTSKFFLT